MSHFRIDDYVAGIAALLLIFAVVQVALYAGRHARVRDPEHKDQSPPM
jgi:hypothetical protein